MSCAQGGPGAVIMAVGRTLLCNWGRGAEQENFLFCVGGSSRVADLIAVPQGVSCVYIYDPSDLCQSASKLAGDLLDWCRVTQVTDIGTCKFLCPVFAHLRLRSINAYYRSTAVLQMRVQICSSGSTDVCTVCTDVHTRVPKYSCCALYSCCA